MNDDRARRRAAIKARVPSRFIAVCAVAMVSALAVGTLVQAGPVQAGTSDRYDRLWDKTSKKQKRWARATSKCESGRDRDIHSSGGHYHGAFQFSLRTWRHSPKTPGGDPHRESWRTQAVVAVQLKKRDGGKTHWPSCG